MDRGYDPPCVWKSICWEYLERLVSTIVRRDILGKQKIIMDRGTFCHTLVRNSQEGIDPFFFIAVLYTLLIN